MAGLIAARVDVTLWARRPELSERIRSNHVNADYLPGVALPSRLSATSSTEEALQGADVVVIAVPSHGLRNVVSDARSHLGRAVPIVSLSKGMEQGTLKRMTEVLCEMAPDSPRGVLTGPTLVHEVVAGYPTASVVAMATAAGPDEDLAGELQQLFNTQAFRVYTNPDLVGCELGGALKNVMAIASGISDGLGFGDNARAALITRGLAELTRLGMALGGRRATFAGLTGMGDLVATCMSSRSRNRHVGEQLGRGRSIRRITGEMRMVAEGVRTSRAVVDLARRVGIEMPIAEQIAAAIYDDKPASEVLSALMLRDMRPEIDEA